MRDKGPGPLPRTLEDEDPYEVAVLCPWFEVPPMAMVALEHEGLAPNSVRHHVVHMPDHRDVLLSSFASAAALDRASGAADAVVNLVVLENQPLAQNAILQR
jgi:hypothetical protein